MKAMLSLVVLLAGAIQPWAQGTVNFGNNSSTAITNCATGRRLEAGNNFIAELWYAPDLGTTPTDADMVPLSGARTGISPVAGLITGGTKTTPNTTAPGATAYFQIRVWEAAYGDTWDTALNSWYGLLGKSSILKVKTGDPGAVPPGTPGSLVGAGLKPFVVGGWTWEACPEPSTYALTAFGTATLWGLRRKARRRKVGSTQNRISASTKV